MEEDRTEKFRLDGTLIKHGLSCKMPITNSKNFLSPEEFVMSILQNLSAGPTDAIFHMLFIHKFAASVKPEKLALTPTHPLFQ